MIAAPWTEPVPAPLLKLIVLAVALLVSLAGCSDDGDAGGKDRSSAIAASEDFNQADVDFATEMVQHHAQALAMVDLTDSRDVSPAISELAEQIRMTQGPEIELMVDWLNEWDQPVPETMRDHANAHGDAESEMGADLPGMMSAEEMATLAAAQGEEFERLFLESMIEHHLGAVEMATTEKSEGEDPDAIALADAIIDTQQREIGQMEALLGP